ncbi:Bug family tripartite tricarboxylate transporter substrate binding protein [Ramlibacter sp.]|uniref:Bug family tripartite tricarboxylate transporter substrate binding protein n=1 Tax=Ramlibacter sp. TaxID=1917967 RepID=UPI003D0EDF9F
MKIAFAMQWVRRVAPALSVALVFAAGTGNALAQAASFPSKPLRFIVPVGPGSNSDVLARWMADRTAKALGTTAIVENKPGGEMLIGMAAFLQSPPDGHTITLLSPTAMIINPITMKDMPYDVDKDVRPVSGSMRSIAAIVVGPNSKYTKLADLIADAKARPGAVSMAWYAQSFRLGLLEIERDAKVKFNPIAYKAPNQVTTDIIGGSLDGTLMDFGAAMQLAKGGKVRILAQTGDARHPGLPDAPTATEAGVPYKLFQFSGFGVSSKTPDDIARKIEATMLGVVNSAEYRKFIEDSGAEPIALTGAQMAKTLADERAKYREILKGVGS